MSKSAAEIRAMATASLAATSTEVPQDANVVQPAPVPEDKDTIIANLQKQLEAAMGALGVASVAKAVPTEPKLYSCVYPFMRFPVMRAPGHCEFVEFVEGKLKTADPVVIDAIEKAIVAGGSGITHGSVAEAAPEEAIMREDIRKAAETAHNKMVSAGLPTA